MACAAGGAAVTSATVASAGTHEAATPASSRHFLKGGYVLTDGKCPKGTVKVNARVRAQTNSPTGRSWFPLCFVKK
jgi:hypothetical protein